ncbi:MAG: AAA family ATPase [Tabrizicola sp.]|nr:AAA family ATPase [Tabrizicola sp.]
MEELFVHHISNVIIKNFKSISSCEFPLSYYTPLVGYNNAGKTNILRAISWAIRKSSLSSEDFHNSAQPVEVEAEISGITEEVLHALGDVHRPRIEPLVVDGKVRIKRTQLIPGAPIGAIRFEVEKIEDGHRIWAPIPTGIDAAIMALFPEPIFVGAMENATEDVAKFGAGTTIGKLLKEIMSPVVDRHTPTVANALLAVASQLSATSENKDETLVALDARIQAQLERFFPGVTAKSHVPVPEFADFMKGATIKLFEQGFDNGDGRDVAALGHGAQRSVQISLIKCLSEVKREADGNAGRTTLLLIDEPELYLHPQAIEVVRSALNRLSGEGYQVIATTHSANMITRRDAPNTLLIRRNVAQGTVCMPRIGDAVRDVIVGADHQSDILFGLSNSAKILFSERVGIAEGKTERAILPAIFEREFGVSPDEDKLGLVEVGGSSNVHKAKRVLDVMGVPCKSIVDLDFAFQVAPTAGLIDNADASVAACKVILQRLRDQGLVQLDAAGLPQSFNGTSAAQAFEVLAQQVDAQVPISEIHTKLLEAGIWVWTKGAIEAHLGIAKTNPARAAFLEQLHDEGYRAGLPDYQSVVAAVTWLRE